MGMVFLPYLSDVVVQRIFYTKSWPALAWYHYSIFPMLILNFMVVVTGYKALDLLFPTLTITMIRSWLSKLLNSDTQQLF